MNIVYTSDNKFIRQIATGIASVIENNEDEKLDFFVVSKGITKENREIITGWVESRNQHVTFIELGDIKELCGMDIDTGSWNDIVLARLFFDRLLGPEVERVLYLDGDTIVRGSLKGFYNMDMGDAVIAAAIEPTASKDRKKLLDLAPDDNYYNAGVLLMDLKKWVERDTGKRIIEYFKMKGGHLPSNDQDAINGCLKNEIVSVSIKYNYCNTYNFYPYRAVRKMTGKQYFYSKEDYKSIIANPVIVHFLGEERPWRYGSRHKFGSDFFKYYLKTPYGKDRKTRGVIMERGWRKYFFFFYTFNFFIKPFPMLRWHIMNRLIPVMIKIRKKS